MEKVIEASEAFVTRFLNEKLHPNFVYHNLAHTQRVVSKTKEIIESSDVSSKERDQLIVAAWFHDTGFTVSPENHEEESVKIAEKFLNENGVSEDDIRSISEIILATKMERQPSSTLEGYIRDADAAHIASKSYNDYAALLKKEWELTENRIISKEEWIDININFLQKHSFYSDFAIKNWEQRKSKNLASLLQSQSKTVADSEKLKHKKEELKFKKNKLEVPDRGIETMFRVALKNHITLSDIADTKANILLSVNAIIISVALSNLLPKLDNPSNSYLIYPTLIFLFFTVVCIVLSVLATRPNVTKGKFTKEDVANKKVNLLFFGNFHQMQLSEFEWAMKEMMQDKNYLYGSLTKDLYFLGLVLNRKYNLLRVTYSVFMVGIIVSVAAFGIAFILSEQATALNP